MAENEEAKEIIIGSRATIGDEEEEEEEREEGKGMRMKPWEQHSAVISIPRYDYKAPSSLLHHSFSGFLVTCPIKREKSATKEAISIFEKCIRSFTCCNSESSEGFDGTVDSKRRKVSIGEILGECNGSVESKSEASISGDTGTISEGSCLSSLKSNANADRHDALSLVKLTRSGLLLFTFPRDSSPNVVGILSTILQSLGSGSLKSPLWCHRILPIQATCTLNEKELRTLVTKLVVQFVNDKGDELARPIKFAVGYNRRGIDETEMKGTKVTSDDPNAVPLLDRNKCFEVVAAAVKDAISDSVVDLKCPELSVLVELLPLSGVPARSLVVSVSVIPLNLVSTKPRLGIKALVSDMNARNGRKKN